MLSLIVLPYLTYTTHVPVHELAPTTRSGPAKVTLKVVPLEFFAPKLQQPANVSRQVC